MDKPDNGGPVFPLEFVDAGLTKRDYFAAAAMQSLLVAFAIAGKTEVLSNNLAGSAYMFADAMLAERGRGKDPA